MATSPSDIAKSELVQFLRENFRRTELDVFVRTFFPSVHSNLEWNIHTDIYADAVAICARHGLLDETFFIGLYLCRRERARDIPALMKHFGVDPEILHSLATIAPSLQRRRRVALVAISGAAGIITGLMLGTLAANLPWQQTAEPSSVEPLSSQSSLLLPLIRAELEQCNEQYGQESEQCAQLAEAMRTVNLSTCQETATSSPAGSKRPRKDSPAKLDIALTNYLDRKQAEYRTLRMDLQACRSNLAKAELVTATSQTTLPHFAPSPSTPPAPQPDSSHCSGEKPWSCKAQFGADGTFYNCAIVRGIDHAKQTTKADDDVLMPIVRQR